MDKPRQMPEPLVIPYQSLSPSALQGLIESFVLREGTDYGPVEVPLNVKRSQVMRSLEEGTARIMFDPRTDSTDIELVHAPVRRRR